MRNGGRNLTNRNRLNIKSDESSRKTGLSWILVNLRCQPPTLPCGSGPIINNGSGFTDSTLCNNQLNVHMTFVNMTNVVTDKIMLKQGSDSDLDDSKNDHKIQLFCLFAMKTRQERGNSVSV